MGGICNYKGCKEWALSACIIIDGAGNDFHRDFCAKHIKKMCHNEKGVCLEAT